MQKQSGGRKPPRRSKDNLKPARARPGQQDETRAEKQLGGTEQQVAPLTPPMARSDEQPGDPERGAEPGAGIDPADELTPG